MVIEITYALKKLREHRGGGSTTFFNLLISNIFSVFLVVTHLGNNNHLSKEFALNLVCCKNGITYNP